MRCLVEFLSIKGGAESEDESWSKHHIVGNVTDASIVQFGLMRVR